MAELPMPTQFIGKEKGSAAITALEWAKKKFGDPAATDKSKSYPKIPPKADSEYWTVVCPKCKGIMHVAYTSVVGIRYQCGTCGGKSGNV